MKVFGYELLLISILLCSGSEAQVTYIGKSSADAFLPTGSSANPVGEDLTHLNFGGAGTLVVAPASSAKGEVQSLVRFSLSDATNLFTSSLGTNWIVRAVSLELTSNYGTAGVQPNNAMFDVIREGSFVIEWLGSNDWSEGTGMPSLATTDGVTFGELPGLLAAARVALSTNNYTPPGNNVHVTWQLPLAAELVANIRQGGDVTFRFFAADENIFYLFNSHEYRRGNEPIVRISAVPPLTIISSEIISDRFRLTGACQPDTDCLVQACSDLAVPHWETIVILHADSSGYFEFNDASVNEPKRFYRLAQ